MAEKLKVEVVDVATLKQDPNNARLHPERNLEAIASSLRRFGQQKPIVVDQDGVVVAGNGTLEAALRLGWPKVAVVRTSLEGHERTAFAVADNKTSDLAEWDYQQLAAALRELPEGVRTATAFADFEIEPLLQADWTPPAPTEMPTHLPESGHSVHFAEAEYERVEAAVAKVRERSGLSEIGAGGALAIVCGEWLGA